MLKKQIIFTLLILSLFTAGCGSRFSLAKRKKIADNIAALSGMQEYVIEAELFDITTWQRVPLRGETIHLYIEGDGLAWLSKHRVSKNPTPLNPVGLELATRDRHPNVIYIARPCQYSGWNRQGHCSSIYWTHGRTAPEIMRSYQALLDKIKMKYANKDFVITGYSGGAAVAAILAGLRDDVTSFRTVAGNLDYQTFTSHHKVSPMRGSMDPINFAYDTREIPQIHFIGARDEIVPEVIFNSWSRTSDNPSCVRKFILPRAKHDEGWAQEWNRLQKMEPGCY